MYNEKQDANASASRTGGDVSHGLADSDIRELQARFESEIAKVKVEADLESIKRDWLSKDGTVKQLFQKLRDVPGEEKPAVAACLNQLKEFVETAFSSKASQLQSEKRAREMASQYIDLSLPGNSPGLGAVHPVSIVEEKISNILRPFGFSSVMGPEIETEYYCFDALNIPKHHPARDMQDTFYTDTGHILRTHTTSVQARTLQNKALFENGKLPIKIASFGRVYRNETEDATHQAMFHQFELVWVEEGLTLAHLMGLITHIIKELYGRRRKVRFVPKFYPYTEPSLGPQIDCSICKGNGCPACGGAGWVTVGGSGMIHRKVLEEFKFDPSKVSGFAFGLGTSRLAGQVYQFPHLRSVYDNDLRVLKELV